jgi:hypothetical protein
MAARRLLVVMFVLLAISMAAWVLAPTRPGDDEPTTTTPGDGSAAAAQPTRGRLREATLRADAQPRRLRLRTGDQLALTVRSQRPGQVAIRRLGLLEDVGPLAPARFDLLAERPGRYELQILGRGRPIGVLIVRSASESGRRAGRSADTSRSR